MYVWSQNMEKTVRAMKASSIHVLYMSVTLMLELIIVMSLLVIPTKTCLSSDRIRKFVINSPV